MRIHVLIDKNMKNIKRLLSILLLICIVITSFVGCSDSKKESGGKDTGSSAAVDYAAQAKLELDGSSITAKVTVKQFVDGDTTHFYINDPSFKDNYIKARYLGVNTPESTGQIEEWGKAASNFTKEKLKGADEIIIESEDGIWNPDSTGDRYLVWVWYKAKDEADYHNLNLELLQNGLAIASNTSATKYGELGVKAIEEAEKQKLHIHSEEKDPDFYYGKCIELTLKELRANPEKYTNKTVAFEGIITMDNAQTVYVEAFDEETNMYNGIPVYYGFNLKYGMGDILKIGNKVRVVGSMQYYEAGDSYQISDLDYDMMDPDNPDNIMKLGDGEKAAYVETSIDTFVDGKVSITVVNTETEEEEIKELPYAQLALGSSISMKNLKVTNTYTTANGGSNDGAISITCQSGGKKITVRTTVLQENGSLVTADRFDGKTLDVKGIVDCFDGDYQIKVFSMNDIVIH